VTAVRRIRGQALELWERHRAVAALEAARLGDGPTARAARAAFPPSSDPAAPTLTPSSMSAEAYPPRRRRIFDSQFRHAGTVTHSTPSGLHPLSPAAESRADATARANWRVVAAAEAAREPRVLKAHQVERAGEDAVQLSGAANAVSPRRRGAPTYWASRH
jgi:glycine/D-amino acid oxidase-like deaminating enzyme